jgi:hypothetical protein
MATKKGKINIVEETRKEIEEKTGHKIKELGEEELEKILGGQLNRGSFMVYATTSCSNLWISGDKCSWEKSSCSS